MKGAALQSLPRPAENFPAIGDNFGVSATTNRVRLKIQTFSRLWKRFYTFSTDDLLGESRQPTRNGKVKL
jgi:hypothetical protein